METKRNLYNEDEILTLEFDDGVALECGIMGTFEVNGREIGRSTTLYVLMDAKTVNMQVAAAIYGSVLAPFTRWNANESGGNINGNAALAGLYVPAGSGFELHWFPFTGGMTGLAPCEETPETPDHAPGQPEMQPCPPSGGSNGLITGVMQPCGQCQWRLKLQLLSTRRVLTVWSGSGMAQFSFEADPAEDYLLIVETCCHYEVRLQQMGVRSLTLRG